MNIRFIADKSAFFDIFLRDPETDKRLTIAFAKDPGLGKVVFDTTDKKTIELLIGSNEFMNGVIYTDVPEEILAKYLDDSTITDYFTAEDLSQVSDEGMIKLGSMYPNTSTIPALLRVQLRGKPVTTVAREIMMKYRKVVESDPTTDLVEKLGKMVDAGVIIHKNKVYYYEGAPLGNRKEVLAWLSTNPDILEQHAT